MAKRVTVVLDDKEHEEFKMACGHRGLSMHTVLVGMIRGEVGSSRSKKSTEGREENEAEELL